MRLRENDPGPKCIAALSNQKQPYIATSKWHTSQMSMPERLRRAVSTHFGPASKALEQQFQTRSIMLGEMERRGYPVREKTDEQIVQMLQRRIRNEK